MDQKASIGRIVHFVVFDGPNVGEHRPAIVQEVADDSADLFVFFKPEDFRPAQAFLNIRHSETAQMGTWHWPEKV